LKFLCDNCKAKYQISDDKVAGKTVRMKCRKCGHQIEVRAAVTETSVSVAPPKPDAPQAAPAHAGHGGATVPVGAGPTTGGAGVAAPKKPGLATSLSSSLSSGARPQTQRMPRPEPGALAGAFNKSLKDEQLAHAAHHAGPASSLPLSSHPPSNLDMLDVSMTEEWYVAINGVPVGPIRVSELRRKAAAGAIHDDSLCWQEGLEEWRPVKAIPELARIVREAAQSGRPSLTANNERPSQTPPPPGTGTLVPSSSSGGASAGQPRAPVAPARPATAAPMAPTAPRPAPAAPTAPVAPAMQPLASPFGPSPLQSPMQPAARNNVVPISAGRLATAGRLDEPAAAVFTPPPAPVAPPPPVAFAAPALAPPAAPAAPILTSDPFAPMGAPSPFSTSPNITGAAVLAPAVLGTSVPSLAPLPPQKKGTPIWVIAIIAFAGCFGIAVAVIVFMPKPVPAQPVVIQVPTPVPAGSPGGSPAVDPSAALAIAPPSASPDPSGAPSAKVASKPSTGGAVAAAAPSATHTGADLKNLLGGGPSGPSDSPGGGGGGGGSGSSGLDSKAVENVVAARRSGIKRKCWDTGNNDQKPSANVQVAVTVAPGGSVSNAVATGDEPVATCIAREVKGWSFPAPGSQTTVNIPFHFVRQ
jgi:predicted Zn finger-like uncharacterized protein